MATAPERAVAAPTGFPASWQATLADALVWAAANAAPEHATVLHELAEDWLRMRDKARASRDALRGGAS